MGWRYAAGELEGSGDPQPEISMNSRPRHFTAAHMLSRLFRLLLPTVLIAVTAASARAQDESLHEGARVRLDTRSSREIVGIVKSFDNDSVSLYTDNNGATLSLARNDVTGIRVSQGKSATRGAIRGAMWGSAVGALAGAIVIVAIKTDDSYIESDGEAGYAALNSLIGGALWGAGIGAFVKSERWKRVSMRPRVVSSPSGARFGLKLQSTF